MDDGVECPFTGGDCDLPAIHVPVAMNVDAALDRSYGRRTRRKTASTETGVIDLDGTVPRRLARYKRFRLRFVSTGSARQNMAGRRFGLITQRRTQRGTYQPMSLREALEEPEKRILEAALRANGWNRQLTAEQLGINRTTLYKKMKRYGLDAEPSHNRA
jgi:DNA-binding NtrC family response regulator